MGYGRHVYTKPVMRTTPGKGTPYHFGILVAVMEDMPKQIPAFLNVADYKIRTRHNGQEIHNHTERRQPRNANNQTLPSLTHQQPTSEPETNNSKHEKNPYNITNVESIKKLAVTKKKINIVFKNEEKQTNKEEEKKQATKQKKDTQYDKTKEEQRKTLETRRKDFYFEKPTNKEAEEEEENHSKDAEKVSEGKKRRKKVEKKWRKTTRGKKTQCTTTDSTQK